jgi:tetratricopeptide (TPR) repeat protein
LQKQALGMRRKLLGDEHPETAASLNNLALLFRQEGKWTEAEGAERESLAIQTKLNGRESLPAATALSNLGLVLLDEGKLPEAESALREALATQRRFLPDDHPSIAVSRRRLAEVLKRGHKTSEPEPVANTNRAGAPGRMPGTSPEDGAKSVVQAK